jgi:hypothetical protein
MRAPTRTARLLVCLGLALLGAALPAATSGAASTGVPYTDPNAVGYIGLCNQAGQQITSGSVTTTPFVWRAVSSQAAPVGYDGPSRTATLTAYLPLQALPAGDWSGEELTSASEYSNPANPMAAATTRDVSLETFIQDYPPEWDGFIQLRMILGADGKQIYSFHYPTLGIKVTGDTWQAVGGGPVDCSSGTSESIETMLLPGATGANGKGTGASTTNSTTATPGAGVGTGKATGSGPGGSQGSGSKGSGSGTHSGSGSPGPATASSSMTASATSHVPLIAGLVIAALAVLTTLAFIITRRRRGSGPTPPEPTTTS